MKKRIPALKRLESDICAARKEAWDAAEDRRQRTDLRRAYRFIQFDAYEAEVPEDDSVEADFAQGILQEERAEIRDRHAERCIQAQFTGSYKPSRVLEAKRFPQLPRVKARPRASAPKPDLRAELEALVAGYTGPITVCPPEKTTRMLNKRLRGRPPTGERAMTAAERKRRQRDKLRIIVTPPPPPRITHVRAIAKPLRKPPVALDRGGGAEYAKRKAAR